MNHLLIDLCREISNENIIKNSQTLENIVKSDDISLNKKLITYEIISLSFLKAVKDKIYEAYERIDNFTLATAELYLDLYKKYMMKTSRPLGRPIDRSEHLKLIKKIKNAYLETSSNIKKVKNKINEFEKLSYIYQDKIIKNSEQGLNKRIKRLQRRLELSEEIVNIKNTFDKQAIELGDKINELLEKIKNYRTIFPKGYFGTINNLIKKEGFQTTKNYFSRLGFNLTKKGLSGHKLLIYNKTNNELESPFQNYTYPKKKVHKAKFFNINIKNTEGPGIYLANNNFFKIIKYLSEPIPKLANSFKKKLVEKNNNPLIFSTARQEVLDELKKLFKSGTQIKKQKKFKVKVPAMIPLSARVVVPADFNESIRADTLELDIKKNLEKIVKDESDFKL